MEKNNFKYLLQPNITHFVYRLIFISIFGIFFIQCSEGELTTSEQPTIVSYGACELTEDTRFSVENCKSPDQCHVKDLGDGICRPSCGHLAKLSEEGKYGGYGPDKQQHNEDDPHYLSKISCETTEKWGADDWRKISLINDLEPYDVVTNREQGYTNSECCGSDQQVESNNAQ